MYSIGYQTVEYSIIYGSSGGSALRLKNVDTLIPLGVASKNSKPRGQHVHESVVSRVSHSRL